MTNTHRPSEYHRRQVAVSLFQTPGTNTEGKQMQLN